MNTALIVAAGSGSRTKLNESKVLYKINDKPLFLYSVETFLALEFNVVLVVSKNDIEEIKQYIAPGVKIVLGGQTRGDSVINGLKEVETPYVHIHDAARPLISKNAILEVEKALHIHDAVLLAQRVTSALKLNNEKGLVSLNREKYLLAQTPQAFVTEKIKQAYLKNDAKYDDDISLYQKSYPNEKVFVVYNQEPNTKITYKEDVIYLQRQLKKE